MKQNQNEELQSRREFFKKAAKTALPVVGAVVLASLPMQQVQAMGCAYMTCSSGCMSSCKNTCSYSSCKGSCSGTCKRLMK